MSSLKHIITVSTLTALAMLAGCNRTEKAEGGAEKPAPAKRQFISIGTAPVGGTFFVIGGAFAQVVNDNKGDLPWQVSQEATKGTQENIRRLVQNDMDFALANAAISYFAYRGEGDWGSVQDIRTVMTLAPNIAMFITPRSSGIEQISQMKGKRVSVGPSGAGFEYFLKPILEAHGVTYDDFTPLNNTQSGAVAMLADGSAAAAFLGGAVPTASITQASSSQDILLIPFDEAAKEKLVNDYPFFFPASIPAATYRGQDEAYHGLNVGSMHLITSAGKDENTVYEFTKRLYEHRAEVVKQHPAGRAINPNNVIRDTGTPFHEGAIRYYREIGIWPEASEDEEDESQ